MGGPGVFFVIDDEDTWQELDFVTEHLEGDGAGQEGGVEENAVTERERVGDFAGEAEFEDDIGGGGGFLGERDENISDGQEGLIDEDGGRVGGFGGEGDLPGAFAVAAMFDAPVEQDVACQGDEEGEQEVFDGIVTLHFGRG